MRGPFEPIMIGIRRAGGGSSTRSSTWEKLPSMLTRSPASRPCTIWNDSAKRDTRRS